MALPRYVVVMKQHPNDCSNTPIPLQNETLRAIYIIWLNKHSIEVGISCIRSISKLRISCIKLQYSDNKTED